ncbi:MAG: hypothetical protein Q9166_001325 [cf. Caloplaca sp. 2 TL-2023]
MPGPPSNEPIDLPPIDVSSPEEARVSFRSTDLDAVLPFIRARFPNIEPLYLTKIFRGTIGSTGLIWLDIDRQEASGLDFSDLAHLMYCFEVYGQIVCMMASAEGVGRELELQCALADFRIRVLKFSKWALFESLLEWFKAFVDTRLRHGQDRPEGWMERRDDLSALLRKRM